MMIDPLKLSKIYRSDSCVELLLYTYIYLALVTDRWRFAKELVVVDVIKDKNPFSDISVLYPIADDLKYIGVPVLAP